MILTNANSNQDKDKMKIFKKNNISIRKIQFEI